MGWQGLVAPKGTPDHIVRKVARDLEQVLAQDEVKQQLDSRGSPGRLMSSAEVITFVHEQQKTWDPILQKLAPQP